MTDGVYVAIGYGLANSIMIEGDTGLIIGILSYSLNTFSNDLLFIYFLVFS